MASSSSKRTTRAVSKVEQEDSMDWSVLREKGGLHGMDLSTAVEKALTDPIMQAMPDPIWTTMDENRMANWKQLAAEHDLVDMMQMSDTEDRTAEEQRSIGRRELRTRLLKGNYCIAMCKNFTRQLASFYFDNFDNNAVYTQSGNGITQNLFRYFRQGSAK
jgi:hypothetical protein